MKNKLYLGITLVLSICLCGSVGFCQGGGDRDIVLVGAKIYPSPVTAAIENGVVIIRNGKITAVGPGDKITIPATSRKIDCHGMVLTAAFWNCHVHFIEPKWGHADLLSVDQFNRQMTDMLTAHGFAHIFDLAELNIENVLLIRDRIKKGDVQGPLIYTAGVPLTPPEGSPFYIRPMKLPEASTPEAAAAHVRQQIDSGADAIKIWTGSPTGKNVVYMPEEVAKEVTKTAHQLGKPVFSHPTDNKGVEVAIDCGVDVLAHTAPDGGEAWKPAAIQRMLDHHLAVIPTLKLWKEELLKAGVTDWANHPLVLTAQQQLRDFSQAGGQVLFGTDVGYITDYSTGDEYALMAGAGMDYRKILTALTTAPAQRFGLAAQTGQVAAGMDADIVVLRGDPALDVRSFDKVAYTICHGKIIFSGK